MIVLAYLVAVILFAVTDIIAGAIAIALANRIALHPIGVQFWGALVGTVLGGVVAPTAFGWFEKSANVILLFVILELTWLATNATIAPEHAPTAQRVGSTLGLAIAFVYMFLQ